MAGRRGNNEGNIKKRSDGRWEARVSLPNGKRKSVYGRTRADVAAKMTAVMKSAQDGVPVPNERITVGRYLDEWFAGHKGGIRHSTSRRYEQLIRIHLQPHLGRHRLASLTVRHINTAYGEMLAAGSAARTIRQAHAVLSKAFRDADMNRMISHNPVQYAKPPKVEDPSVATLDEAQARQLLNAVAGSRMEALFVLATAHGLRQGELLGLRWPDLNLETGILTVRVQLQAVRTSREAPAVWQLVAPKTKQARRSIRLSDTARQALVVHKARQAEERLGLGPAWDTSWNLVFPNTIGRPMDGGNLTDRYFAPALAAAELPRIRFHDLRHTCATLLLKNQVPLKVVSEMLGHRDPAYTLRLYQHVLPDMQKQAAHAVDQLFG